VLLERDGVVLGTQALIPIKMIDTDGVFLTAKSEETLLDPTMRGEGALERMYALLFARAEEMSITAIWGFTPAVKAFIRLGFDVPGRTAQLLTVLDSRGFSQSDANRHESAGRVPRRVLFRLAVGLASVWSKGLFGVARRARRVPQSLHMSIANDVPTGAAQLMHSFVTQWGGCTLFRDSEYLRWRVFSNPWIKPRVLCAYVGGSLAGWVIYSSGTDGLGYIVDIVASDGHSASISASVVVSALLYGAVEDLRNGGTTAIRAWSVSAHPFDRLVRREARRLGFLLIDKGNPFVLWRATERVARSSQSHFDAWYMTRIYTEGTNG